jgi:tritrans,polycis-undecaprenyl-diphosphate synthase [geranylgeranyl-diphosphate specific]
LKLGLNALIYKIYERRLWAQIKDGIHQGVHPKHIALIMDGNRRFARAKNLPSHFGHRLGGEKLKEILQWMWDLHIDYLTLYAFSTENFQRDDKEVGGLMNLFEKTFRDVVGHPEIKKRNVKIKVIGRTHLLPVQVQEAIRDAEASTQTDKDGPTLIIAIGYGGRAEMIDAIRSIAKKIQSQEITIDDINEVVVERHLYTNGIPDPDLIIRTSGEERLSGFLTWQSAYSELYFADVFFPGFRKIDLWRAIRVYQSRQRRHGK